MTDNRDKILMFLSKNKDNHFNQRDIQKRILTVLNKDQVKDLLYQIIEYDTNLMRVFNESNIGILPVQYSGLIDDFLSDGGFEKIESDLYSKSNSVKEKELLELDNLKLQKENLIYQKSIREKEAQINNLTIDNLRLGNWDVRFRWLIAIITFTVGFITKYFIDKQ